MRLETDFLRSLRYTEINLKNLDLVPESVVLDDTADLSGISFKDGKPFTKIAIKNLCSYLKIPYQFTKQLQTIGRSNVIVYLQKQLSQVSDFNVILVEDSDRILSITDEEKLHYKGSELINIDKRIQDAVKESQLDLVDVVSDKGSINYLLFHKQKPDEEIEPDSSWRWGFIISFSALGEAKPTIGVIVQRSRDASMAILPTKTYSYPLDYESELEDRWNAIASFIQNPPAPAWMTLEASVTKLKKTVASFREVKETRSKLGKLKIDKEDNETLERLNTTLQMKRIAKEYAVKDLSYTPTKLWYCRASTPLTLFEVFNFVAVEATAAPNTLPFELRRNLYMYAGNLLLGTPDLAVEQNPPAINWK